MKYQGGRNIVEFICGKLLNPVCIIITKEQFEYEVNATNANNTSFVILWQRHRLVSKSQGRYIISIVVGETVWYLLQLANEPMKKFWISFRIRASNHNINNQGWKSLLCEKLFYFVLWCCERSSSIVYDWALLNVL